MTVLTVLTILTALTVLTGSTGLTGLTVLTVLTDTILTPPAGAGRGDVVHRVPRRRREGRPPPISFTSCFNSLTESRRLSDFGGLLEGFFAQGAFSEVMQV